MDTAILPSPTPSMADPSSTGPGQLFRYEDPAPQQCHPSTSFDTDHLVSRSVSRYQSPDHTDVIVQPSAPIYAPLPNALGFSFPTLRPGEDPTALGNEDPVAGAQASYNLKTPEASPPIQAQQLTGGPSTRGSSSTRGTQGSKVLGVRSGRIEKRKKAPSASPPGGTRKDRPGKASGSSEAVDGELTQPLSILTKDWDIPFVDIDAYVHRSVEERHNEVNRGKDPGKVRRAMNAFMLYRKAYQECAKKWAQQSNHQVVSKICGVSWRMEPDSVRRKFNDWAGIERENHRKAHPEYKFTPSKPRKKSKDEFDNDSELDDPDWEGSNRMRMNHRSSSRAPLDVRPGDFGRPHTLYGDPYAPGPSDMSTMPFHTYGQRHPPPPPPPPPPSQLPHLTRHSSAPYGTDDFSGGMGHYHQSMPPPPGPPVTGHPPGMDDMAFANTQQHQTMGLAGGAPSNAGHGEYDLGAHYVPQSMGQQSLGAMPSQAMGLGQQIDPSLMTRDGLPQYDMAGPVLGSGPLVDDPHWAAGLTVGEEASEMYAGPYYATLDETSILQEAQMQYLQDEDTWKVESLPEADNWHHQGEMQ